MTARAETQSKVDLLRHSSVDGICWSMVLQSDENLFRILPRGVVSKNLRGKQNHYLLTD